MSKYIELDKLETYLRKHGYEYTRARRMSAENEYYTGRDFGEQIIVFENGNRKWDAVCGWGTYGGVQGLLEVMGEAVVKPTDGDSVCGWLTAQDVICRIEEKGGANND